MPATPRFYNPTPVAPSPYTPASSGSRFDQGRRNALAQIAALENGNVRVRGSIVVNGIGEATQTATFPVQFTAKPSVSFSFERTNAPANATIPTFSAVILGYTKSVDANGDPTSWNAMSIALVLGGDDAQTGELSWVAEGPVVLSSGL